MSDNLIQALEDLTREMNKLGEAGRLSAASIALFNADMEKGRVEFEATLTDEERAIYQREKEAGAGWLDAAVAIQDRRDRRSS